MQAHYIRGRSLRAVSGRPLYCIRGSGKPRYRSLFCRMQVFRRVVLSALHHPFPAGISSEVVGLLSSRRAAVSTCGCGCVRLCYGSGKCMGCIQVVRPACKVVAESQTLPRQGKESPVVWRAVRVQPSHIVAPCMPFHSCRCLAIRADVSETLLHGKGMCAFAPLPHIAPRLTSVP